MLSGMVWQIRTNYRCSDQGLAGFACRTSTVPDSKKKQPFPFPLGNCKFEEVAILSGMGVNGLRWNQLAGIES